MVLRTTGICGLTRGTLMPKALVKVESLMQLQPTIGVI